MEHKHRSQAKFLASAMGGFASNVKTYMRNPRQPFVEKINLNETHFGLIALTFSSDRGRTCCECGHR